MCLVRSLIFMASSQSEVIIQSALDKNDNFNVLFLSSKVIIARCRTGRQLARSSIETSIENFDCNTKRFESDSTYLAVFLWLTKYHVTVHICCCLIIEWYTLWKVLDPLKSFLSDRMAVFSLL